MYPRKKPNRSGTISVVVVSKSHGKTRYVHNMGTTETEEEADALLLKTHDWILKHGGQQGLDFDDVCGKELEETARVLDNMDAIIINDTLLLLDRIYDSVGFNRIPDEILHHLVIARVSQPKNATLRGHMPNSNTFYTRSMFLTDSHRGLDSRGNFAV
jgi:hypothetical protein